MSGSVIPACSLSRFSDPISPRFLISQKKNGNGVGKKIRESIVHSMFRHEKKGGPDSENQESSEPHIPSLPLSRGCRHGQRSPRTRITRQQLRARNESEHPTYQHQETDNGDKGGQRCYLFHGARAAPMAARNGEGITGQNKDGWSQDGGVRERRAKRTTGGEGDVNDGARGE